MLAAEANKKVCNIVHLIYRAKKYEGSAKDYEFSRQTMEEHWRAGYSAAIKSLSHPEIFEPPDRLEGVRTFDFAATRGKSELLEPTEEQKDGRA
jgi:NTE family protein